MNSPCGESDANSAAVAASGDDESSGSANDSDSGISDDDDSAAGAGGFDTAAAVAGGTGLGAEFDAITVHAFDAPTTSLKSRAAARTNSSAAATGTGRSKPLTAFAAGRGGGRSATATATAGAGALITDMFVRTGGGTRSGSMRDDLKHPPQKTHALDPNKQSAEGHSQSPHRHRTIEELLDRPWEQDTQTEPSQASAPQSTTSTLSTAAAPSIRRRDHFHKRKIPNPDVTSERKTKSNSTAKAEDQSSPLHNAVVPKPTMDAEFHTKLAQADEYDKQKKYEQAIPLYQELLSYDLNELYMMNLKDKLDGSISGRDCEAFANGIQSAELSSKNSEYEQAVVIYQQLLKTENRFAPGLLRHFMAAIYGGLGECFERLNRPKDAFGSYQQSAMTDSYAYCQQSVVRDDQRDAMYNLSRCYHRGYGTEVNDDLRKEWLIKAARRHHPQAAIELGQLYASDGKTGQAIEYLKQAAREHDPKIHYLLAQQYQLTGRFVDEKSAADWHQKAADWYLKAATSGHGDAQWQLSQCYEHGRGVNQDVKQARHWFNEAMKQNQPEAKQRMDEDAQQQIQWKTRLEHYEQKQGCDDTSDRNKAIEIGKLYFSGGMTIGQNIPLSFRWFSVAEAHYWLGYITEIHRKDIPTAVKQYQLVTPSSSMYYDAQFRLGLCLLRGGNDGVGRDVVEGVKRLQIAADHKHSKAIAELAHMKNSTRICSEKEKDALQLYEKAVDGCCESEAKLAECYQTGSGVPIDAASSLYWSERSKQPKYKPLETQSFEDSKSVSSSHDSKTEKLSLRRTQKNTGTRSNSHTMMEIESPSPTRSVEAKENGTASFRCPVNCCEITVHDLESRTCLRQCPFHNFTVFKRTRTAPEPHKQHNHLALKRISACNSRFAAKPRAEKEGENSQSKTSKPPRSTHIPDKPTSTVTNLRFTAMPEVTTPLPKRPL